MLLRQLAPIAIAFPIVLACDGDTVDAPLYVPPTPVFPGPNDPRPFALSEVGLFDGERIAPDLIAFAPTWPLWSDGLAKRRWLRMRVGTVIDNSDPDHWQLPVGAILFKEFADGDKRLETRVVARTGPGNFDYWMGAFRWREDGSDADFVRFGANNVAGGDHDIPTAEQCWGCHVGQPGRMLGLGTLQLSDPPAGSITVEKLAPFLSDEAPVVTKFGDDDARAALGYMHANCSHCHSPTGVARPDTDIDLSLSVTDKTVEDTGAWETAIGKSTRSWIRPDYPLRIAPGDAAHSALIVRMGRRGDTDQMPPLATKHVDDAALALLMRWVNGLKGP